MRDTQGIDHPKLPQALYSIYRINSFYKVQRIMFGNNTPRGREHRDDGKLQVHEIFYTIQGEGVFSGQPAVFVRLSGCNFTCWFCDTKWDDEHDEYLGVNEIVSKVVELAPDHCKLVVVTGGEPLRQDLSELAPCLEEMGYMMQVETAGAYWQECLLDANVYTTISPKAKRLHPRYLEAAANGGNNRKFTFKYVINADELGDDGLPVEPMQRLKNGEIGGGSPARPPAGAIVYLQPCDVQDPVQNKRNGEAVAQSALKHGYIAGVQVHKLIGVE